MNRMVLTELLNNIIDLYIEDKFNYIYLIDAFNNVLAEEYDENKNTYLEAKLITKLLSYFPYYRLEYELNYLLNQIIELTQGNSKLKSLTMILKNGCLGEMLPNIKRRVTMEAMAHLLELLRIYKTSKFDYKTITMLTKNMIDSHFLNGMDLAVSFNYKQEVLSGIELKNQDLRESLSHLNYKRYKSLSCSLEGFIINNYNEESLNGFYLQLDKMIDTSSLDILDWYLLRKIVLEVLRPIMSKSIIIWNRENREDPNQLSFNLT